MQSSTLITSKKISKTIAADTEIHPIFITLTIIKLKNAYVYYSILCGIILVYKHVLESSFKKSLQPHVWILRVPNEIQDSEST